MRNVAVGSLVAVILFTGLFVSQVEAKSNDKVDQGKPEFKFGAKNHKHFGAKDYKHNDTRSVPIPGTELLLGGGFAGLIAWRARQRKPRA